MSNSAINNKEDFHLKVQHRTNYQL